MYLNRDVSKLITSYLPKFELLDWIDPKYLNIQALYENLKAQIDGFVPNDLYHLYGDEIKNINGEVDNNISSLVLPFYLYPSSYPNPLWSYARPAKVQKKCNNSDTLNIRVTYNHINYGGDEEDRIAARSNNIEYLKNNLNYYYYEFLSINPNIFKWIDKADDRNINIKKAILDILLTI